MRMFQIAAHPSRIWRALAALVVLQPVVNAQFAPAPGSPIAAAAPSAVAIADFNEDGIPDLAIANFQNGTVTVMLGNGTGGFVADTAGGPFKVGAEPASMVAANFNGHMGLAVANEGDGTVTILLGNGTGLLTATGSPITVGSAPVSVAVGDFNGDMIPDLAVANFNSKNVTVLQGLGGGAFEGFTGSPITVGNNPSSVATGTFGGSAGFAVANKGDGTVSVFIYTNGTFTAVPGSPISLAPPGFVGTPTEFPVSVAVADFNGDGRPDLAVVNEGNNTVTVLLARSNGSFAAAPGSTPLPVGSTPVFVAEGYLNDDTIPDLAIANEGSGTITVYLGNGAGGFTQAPGSPITVQTSPVSIAIADLNGDGKPDLAVANKGSNTVTVLLNSLYSPLMVSAANYTVPVATGSLVSIFGTGFASASATATAMPLPFMLGGIGVTLTDHTGAQTELPLIYAGTGQIDAQIPQTASPGSATFTIFGGATTQAGQVTLAAIAPGLFSANGTGQGVAAAQFVADPFLGVEDVFQCPNGAGTCVTVPLDVSAGNAQLVLYGTGIRNSALSQVTVAVGNQKLPATYASAAPNYPGEDQVNVVLPISLAHSGLVQVAVSVTVPGSNGVKNTYTSNPVSIFIQ